MSDIEWKVVYFRKLLSETDNEKFIFRSVKSKEICGHSVAQRSGGGR